VTITGGEPLYQAEFTAEVLRLCRTRGIHTAIESSLFAKYDDLRKVAEHCSLILCDVKHMDSEKHREGTGASNELILENLKRLNQDFNNDIVVRVPLIPGYNDDEDNINKTLEFLCALKRVKGVDLLPFNVFPTIKGVETQPDEHIEKLREIADSYKSLRCSVGGLW